jgi:hypothetical protein
MRIDSRIYKIIDLKMFDIYRSFGGVDNFLRSIISRYTNSEEIIDYLVSNSTSTKTISSNYIQIPLKSALIDFGYEVYTFEGKLLYRVGKSVVWGEAYMDKLLFLSSANGSVYKVKYLTYNGYKIHNILVDRTQSLNGTNTYFDVYSKEVYEVNKKDNLNSILLNKVDLVISNLKVYHLEVDLSSSLSRESIKINPSSRLEVLDTNEGELISFIPISNSFFILEGSNNKPIRISNITGEGINNLIEVSRGVYYTSIGDNTTINTLRSLLGGGMSGNPTQEYIKIIGNIEYI